MKIPLIFDIKRSSTVDGTGIRTVIFFKGCNLDCFWCHNPEGKLPTPQTAFFEEKCTHCGTCGDKKDISRCPVGARKAYGKEYTADELFEIIAADKMYFDATNGGVTFSGGECMLYPEFLAEVAKKCKAAGISVAVDTAGNVPFESFETVLPYVDTFLYDIKSIDSTLHKNGTGADNTLILSNLQRLIKGDKEILIRIPEIPDFNKGDEVGRIKEYCNKYDLPYEVLTYHNIWESKLNALIK